MSRLQQPGISRPPRDRHRISNTHQWSKTMEMDVQMLRHANKVNITECWLYIRLVLGVLVFF